MLTDGFPIMSISQLCKLKGLARSNSNQEGCSKCAELSQLRSWSCEVSITNTAVFFPYFQVPTLIKFYLLIVSTSFLFLVVRHLLLVAMHLFLL